MAPKGKDKKNDDDGKDKQSDESAEKQDKAKLEPISPGKRKRLQKCFEHGSMLSAKGEYDYANQMFTQCVAGDPGNLIYTQNFLGNLIKKYNNNKKGGKLAGMRGAGTKAGMKKAMMKKNWPEAIKSGLELLALNPWDTAACTDMSKACGELELDECQLAYLRIALDGAPKDMSLNRLASETFAHLAHFDEAIRCLERIAAANPNDLELRREIGAMTVEKTINKGGYDDAETSMDVSVDKKAREDLAGGTIELTDEQRFRREIRRHPEEVTNYVNLSDHFFKLEQFDKCEEVMRECVEATDAIRAKEVLEDVQLHRAGLEILRAKNRAAESKDPKAAALYEQMKVELNKRELEVFGARCERYPNDFSLKFELGLRLKQIGKYQDAIKEFQQARNEQRKTAAANLETGECFQQIKQYKLALQAYQEAIKTSGIWDEEVKKLALYRAGRLCKGLKEYDKAEQYLTELAGMDFAYKDVSKLLDEIAKLKGP
ncbi:MAG: tetratricopeptide repeat protein [Planctomycetota bacterium]|nr:tetratricopeptide repeat protein [Planctomycetota bacterium]